MPMLITLELVRDEWSACYQADRLADLYPVPRTVIEVLTLTTGPWANVSAFDRLWTVLHAGVLSDSVLRLSACDSAERALEREREAGREPHPDLWAAVVVARAFALGKATAEEMKAARVAYADDADYGTAAAADTADGAYAAAFATADADAAARSAAHAEAAAGSAAYDKAVASGIAAYDDTTFVANAQASERETQVKRLLVIIEESGGGG